MSTNNRILQLDLNCYADDNHKTNISDEILRNYIKEKIENTGVNFVYLQASSEDNPGGNYKTSDRVMFDPAPYIDNAQVMSPDLLARAAKIIHEIAPDCQVLAWATTLCSAFLIDDDNDTVKTAEMGSDSCNWYKRATPFIEQTHSRLKSFYYALGRCTEDLDGIMFQDDLVLSDWEDVSYAGRDILNSRYGVENLDDKQLYEFLDNQDESDSGFANSRDWHRYKVSAMDNLSLELFESFKQGYKDAFPARFAERQQDDDTRLKCGRDFYSSSILSRSQATGDWYGQDIDTALDIYDHVVIMAYAHMDSDGQMPLASNEARNWFTHLVQEGNRIANSNDRDRADKLIFKLQSEAWKDSEGQKMGSVPANVLRDNAQTLIAAGAVNIGFYPALEPISHFDMSSL